MRANIELLINLINFKLNLNSMKNSYFSLFIILLMLASACKSNQEKAGTEQTKIEEIKLSPSDSSTSFPDAAISHMDYRDGEFTFGIQGNYQLGQQTPDAPQKMCANSAQGQHIHLIVDNKPYEARYEPKFHYKIEDGIHYVLAFLSRSYHESIKTQRASVLVKATIQDSSFKKLEPVREPMIFYSRPKGAYVGADAKKILLDFYLANCTLGNQYKVKATINNAEFIIDNWQPYFIEGLPMGENKITLTLIDSAGVQVNSPLNPVERTFKLQAEPGQ
jgi:hypothetical protein